MLGFYRLLAISNLKAWQCPTLTWRMPHYHRRYSVSLLCSEWIQVVPLRYCRQAYSVHWKANSFLAVILSNYNPFNSYSQALSLKLLGCCMVKPLGSLVWVSSTYHYAYTPHLSTSSSPTALQRTYSPRDDSSRGKFPA